MAAGDEELTTPIGARVVGAVLVQGKSPRIYVRLEGGRLSPRAWRQHLAMGIGREYWVGCVVSPVSTLSYRNRTQ